MCSWPEIHTLKHGLFGLPELNSQLMDVGENLIDGEVKLFIM